MEASQERTFDQKEHFSGKDELRQTKQHISEQAKCFLNRIDFYKFDEEEREITVTDDFGVNVLYDSALEDMGVMEKHLLKVGTFFVNKN